MSFAMKGDNMLDKCNEISNKIKQTLSIQFHSIPVYDEQYIRAKVKDFNSVITRNFLSYYVTKENDDTAFAQPA